MSTMTDEEFLSRFLEARLTPGEFDHHSHLRAAWLLLHAYGFEEGGERFVAAIKHFVAVHDARSKYHETLTRTWLVAVIDALIGAEEIDDYELFLEARPRLL